MNIYCEYCDLDFIGKMWIEGCCPQCERDYYWYEYQMENGNYDVCIEWVP
jgi:hypothetical protein